MKLSWLFLVAAFLCLFGADAVSTGRKRKSETPPLDSDEGQYNRKIRGSVANAAQRAQDLRDALRNDTLTCSDLLQDSGAILSALLDFVNAFELDKIIHSICATNTELVLMAMRKSIQSRRYLQFFRSAFHGDSFPVKNALIHFLETSTDADALYEMVDTLYCNWATTSINGKGVLHWLVEFDRVKVLKTLLKDPVKRRKILDVSFDNFGFPSQLPILWQVHSPDLSISVVDSDGNTPCHYVQSAQMANILARIDKDWYMIPNLSGRATFKQLLRAGKHEIVETTVPMERRFEEWLSASGIPRNSHSGKTISVDRSNVIQSFLMSCAGNSAYELRRLMVQFEGEYAVDLGGPFREFMTLGLNEIFAGTQNTKPYFTIVDAESGLYAPSKLHPAHTYYYVGQFVALACCANIPVGVEFVPLIYRRIAKVDGWTEEMFSYQHRSIYKHLQFLLEPDVDLPGLCIYFDKSKTGRDDEVTRKNVHEYCRTYMEHMLMKEHQKEIEAFVKGFNSLPLNPIRLYLTPAELTRLLKGESQVDSTTFLNHVTFESYLSDKEALFIFFRQAVKTFNEDQVWRLIKFITGLERLPYGGLKNLSNQITVKFSAMNPEDLPTAATCFHYLHIPSYPSVEVMREKLLMAIYDGQGYFAE